MLALAAAGYDVREVPASRTAQRRKRRRRPSTDIEDAEAIAHETLSDPGLPPAGKHAAPSPAWEELVVIHDWRESLVLQRVRLLNEAEPVLVSLPVSMREPLPATSRVRAALARLAAMPPALTGLTGADRIKLACLAAVQTAMSAIDSQVKDLDKQVPALLADLGCTLTGIHGVGVVTAMTLITEIGGGHRFANREPVRSVVRRSPGRAVIRRGRRPRSQTLARPGRQPGSELGAPHRPRHPGPLPSAGLRLSDATSARQEQAPPGPQRQLANVIIRHMWKDADRLALSAKPSDGHSMTRELRVPRRPLPASSESPPPYNDRAGGVEVPLPGKPVP